MPSPLCTQVPRSPPRPGGCCGSRSHPEPFLLSHARYPQTHVRELKLFESRSGFSKTERYCWDLAITGPVLGFSSGTKLCPVEFLTNFVPGSAQDAEWSPCPHRCWGREGVSVRTAGPRLGVAPSKSQEQNLRGSPLGCGSWG